ncbi:holo-ACP synthase [Candidatus Xianfuyuplasma coldseepsis]|uniref:Holo-[acyl-carrier-protein] synthase n=1 Tax=Candidatus Xianfuyuplasma coldseepsis TaxID=2782163 RepID=A0A7L7KQL6_9MOLU|nr:holo-ACP synthase [Xianfuyuplasma coldseepsis]QMS84875.1 holo-[acyl-carrier-protein] synthase [Xianfuyuplasma coldseepsis]
MSKAIGIDIVEMEEIKERMSDRFVHRILSEQELERYHRIKNTDRRIQYLMGRFAAKEAYSKVYKQFNEPLNFTDVSIVNDEFGAPYIVSSYHPEDTLHVSISHSRHYAVAIVTKE